ncbi:hypothetical protein SGLAM104S_05143 [Streptomyces glaucescens]
MLRRTARRARPESRVTSSPLYRIAPDVGRSRLTSILATVDLPQPDSPTMPRVSPRSRVKSTPSTALTAPTCFLNRTPRISG